jgi:serine/threonine protein kinase
MPLDLPYRLGKYELTQQIGQGATGKVYHALDTFSGQEVAVKLVDQAVLTDPMFDEGCRKQFLNEASLAGRLAHPHVVTILEASVTQDAGYVVMEYVSGGNLVRCTKADALLPLGNVLQAIFKCCGALDYAFRQGIIHRDIKPANIMVASGTDVKISDFGAAVFYSSQASQEMGIGTPPLHVSGTNQSWPPDTSQRYVLARDRVVPTSYRGATVSGSTLARTF